MNPLSFNKVSQLPETGDPNAVYFLSRGNGYYSQWVADRDGKLVREAGDLRHRLVLDRDYKISAGQYALDVFVAHPPPADYNFQLALPRGSSWKHIVHASGTHSEPVILIRGGLDIVRDGNFRFQFDQPVANISYYTLSPIADYDNH